MKRARIERGAALLAAMLVVTLVATFASAALWQQWRSIEVERAERTRVQSAWILTGALDWARLILREDMRADMRSGYTDHLGEPWAVPLQEARLATFLAADQNNTMDTEAAGAFLSGQVTDLQALLNVSNIAPRGVLHDPSLLAFSRLFELLGLPQAELNRMAENLRFASDISTDNRSAAQAPLEPQKVDQLVWLGLSPRTAAALQPYVTVLPATSTKVNLNTAGAEVIYAAMPGIGLADAQRLVAERDRNHFRSKDAVLQLLGNPQGLTAELVDVKSEFFEVRGRLRLDDIYVEERSMVRRFSPDTVKTIWRERGAVDANALARAAAAPR